MPRIDAPTVAEHRAARERALLDAARDLLTADPDRVPTLAEVGERAGLSRSSVYQYFASREDLLSALVRDSFPTWQRRLDTTIAAADGPHGRVIAFVRANLELVADGEHALARTLAVVAPSEDVAERARDFHDQLLVPVLAALRELGAPDPELSAELVNAVVHAASRLVEQTGDLERSLRATTAILDPYLRGLQPAAQASGTPAPDQD
ncbi:TetR/AcrR family transcriptional regulator [Actinotalea fermentans]|uniref:TetR family transcriptional regulator n=1 Tax=Actinotalea fermentans TaxID=43671 RepID=A0A511YTT5_9CELL|nr:TetR/AcrR family transcriptional regulator [Actinotalea fermentans]KGM17731.1 TetR family transcriptional regulator [Actinotalea fermentans ATCC 43279 = JCM 9966 = DSM 3133]GEN78600.1 TetR family transcriptional regulator [Actinotalea fermentans]